MTTSDPEVAAALAQAIVRHLGERRYDVWFRGHTKYTWEDGLLLIGVPNRHLQEYLQSRFTEMMRAAASEVFGRATEVRFTIDPELFQAARREQQEHDNKTSRQGDKQTERPAVIGEDSAPPSPRPRVAATTRKRRWHRLSEFAVGICNRVAHASALSVIEAPGQSANPLVLHGPVGTGKTHLLEGVYSGLRKGHPDWRVCFVTAEDFTNRFVQSMRLGKLGAFRKHFRECDALLVDDLHFLATKRATQEEFLHTFDVLQREGKQLIVTCDVHPKLADEFSPELADRLLGGAVWGLTPPDADTRLEILRLKAAQAGERSISEEVFHHLADQLRGNVRELEGALHSVRHYSKVTSRPIDLALVREALADLLRHSVRVVQLTEVDQAVCRVLKLENGALQSKQRAWAVSHPRMLAMFLARKHTAAAYSEVGQFFGGRNHSTAVAAEKKVRQWLQQDGELALGERRLRVREVMERVERELLR